MRPIDKNMKILNIIFFTATILWMSVIFIFSSQTGDTSSDFSGGITEKIVKIIYNDFTSFSPDKQLNILESTNYIIRKGAHFTEYAILGAFTALTLFTYICKDISRYKRYTIKNFFIKNIVCSTIISSLYAVSDEIHQGFTEDRNPSIYDVCLDSSGSLFAILIISLIFYIFHIKKCSSSNTINAKEAKP